jgi:uncharacterized protein YdeI (YjbR/CyaY-like superfamily)
MECTYETVKKIVIKTVEDKYQWQEKTINDVLDIVNNGKKYPLRNNTEEYRIPEDISTSIASTYFGVDAYTAKCAK